MALCERHALRRNEIEDGAKELICESADHGDTLIRQKGIFERTRDVLLLKDILLDLRSESFATGTTDDSSADEAEETEDHEEFDEAFLVHPDFRRDLSWRSFD